MSDQHKNRHSQISNILIVIGFGYILLRACIEFYAIAWGTGIWLGEFSLKWGLFFFSFILTCLLTLTFTVIALWKPSLFGNFPQKVLVLRNRLGTLRLVGIIVLLALPVWFLQFTPWGVVFSGLYFRLILWIYITTILTVLLNSRDTLGSWSSLLSALLLTTTVFSAAFAFINVSAYPFSIGWSEGNRLWDYSVLFGKSLYNYPADKEIYSLTDVGRQFVGGLPFIFPGVTITAERLWVGATTFIPYVLVGFAAFRSEVRNKKLWVLLAFFTFIFLKQGPIHPPLVLSAFVVALLWRRPLWLAIPLIFVTSYLTEVSRYTWMFAPAIWIVMLEFSGAFLKDGRLQKITWWRSAALGLSGVVGGYFGGSLVDWLKVLFVPGETATLTEGGALSASSLSASISEHPLLWYRLLPNATYGQGVLLALLLSVFPIITLLVYLSATKKWVLNNWQKAAIGLPSLAFLAVGLVISTKAGGGGDLHNMDMFLIGILFSAAIAWENGGRQWLSQIEMSPVWAKGILALLLIIPGIQPLSALRSSEFAEDIPWLVTLTDISDGKFLEMFPPQEETDEILAVIRNHVDSAGPNGDILFMDQRQLLTFGYIEDVELVPEYEKKVLMNQAMADDAVYFSELYAELAAKRFSLIINEPLRAPVKGSGFEFGEESDAWVKWVVRPVLCYYEPVETYKDVQVELLVPRQGEVDCSSELPAELQDQ